MRVTIIATGFDDNSPNPLNGPAKAKPEEEKPAAAPEASDPAADEELPFADPADRGVSAASSVNEDYEKLLKMLTETK